MLLSKVIAVIHFSYDQQSVAIYMYVTIDVTAVIRFSYDQQHVDIHVYVIVQK